MIKRISPEETYLLRREILRKNLPQESHEFSGDFDDQTFHLGYFVEDRIVGIITVLQNGEIAQIRGMAVSEDYQGKGIGKKLVEKAEEILSEAQIHKIWMNARETAAEFYQKLGYKVEGELFNIKPIGFHYVMTKYFNS